LLLGNENAKPFNRIKVMFRGEGYHIIEIPETYDKELLIPCVDSYVDEARMMMYVSEEVDVEYVRALRMDEDENQDEYDR